MSLKSAVVIGTGLIGTSVALALRDRGVAVWLTDADPAAAQLAADIGAGSLLAEDGPEDGMADVAVLAVPPPSVAGELRRAQRRALARCYTDVASVKQLPLASARELGCDLASYVPSHPLSGRERSGPAAARADLFLGMPWVICPLPENEGPAVSVVTDLARSCGGQPVEASVAQHDQWVALVSHAPHVVAAAMAARLADAPASALALAGQGLRDVTRVAAGDAAMWSQILAANAGPAGRVLRDVAADLSRAADALDRMAVGAKDPAADLARSSGPAEAAEVAALLERGRAGVSRIPGKRGGPARGYATVQVVIPDRPGELARLFDAAGQAGINIEDIGIEHSPGLPVGVAELAVRPEAATRLTGVLAAAGWPVRR